MRPATAFVDESFRRGADGRGLFLLTAVIVPDHCHAGIRQRLRRMVPARQQRWHFRAESITSRRMFLAQTAELQHLGTTAVTYCCPTPGPRKSERSRVRCLWNLVADLPGDVRTLVLESRQDHNDRKDRGEIHRAITAGVGRATLVYQHGQPIQEPLLWLPDAIAGALGMCIADGSDEFARLLPVPLRGIRQISP